MYLSWKFLKTSFLLFYLDFILFFGFVKNRLQSMGLIGTITGMKGASGFGSRSTAEEVTEGIDASNLTAIVTGGASGIGAETTRVLALRGAHVVIAARNLAQAAKFKNEVESKMPQAKLDCMELDLSSTASVRKFASEFKAANLPLNILINNAGVMMMPFELSKDGIEMQFATNHIGHFLLTDLLLDKMKRTANETGVEGRIVNLASAAHHFCYKGGIKFDALNKKEEYSEMKAYGQSKLANVLHANELTRRLQVEGANITANSLHPGVIMTPLMRHTAFLKMGFLKIFSGFLWKTVPQGAATTCYVALHPSLKRVSGCYFENCNVSKPSQLAKDTTLAQKLWDFSMDLTKSDSYAKSAP